MNNATIAHQATLLDLACNSDLLEVSEVQLCLAVEFILDAADQIRNGGGIIKAMANVRLASAFYEKSLRSGVDAYANSINKEFDELLTD